MSEDFEHGVVRDIMSEDFERGAVREVSVCSDLEIYDFLNYSYQIILVSTVCNERILTCKRRSGASHHLPEGFALMSTHLRRFDAYRINIKTSNYQEGHIIVNLIKRFRIQLNPYYNVSDDYITVSSP